MAKDALYHLRQRVCFPMQCLVYRTNHQCTRYTLFAGIACSVVYSVLTQIAEETGISVDTLNQGTGYMFLFAGWGLLFWQPLALQYGKRLTLILSLIGMLVGSPHGKFIEIPLTYPIGHYRVGVSHRGLGASHVLTSGDRSPYIHTNGQWIARSILSGFFLAPIEALPEVMVTDVVSRPDQYHQPS